MYPNCFPKNLVTRSTRDPALSRPSVSGRHSITPVVQIASLRGSNMNAATWARGRWISTSLWTSIAIESSGVPLHWYPARASETIRQNWDRSSHPRDNRHAPGGYAAVCEGGRGPGLHLRGAPARDSEADAKPANQRVGAGAGSPTPAAHHPTPAPHGRRCSLCLAVRGDRPDGRGG